MRRWFVRLPLLLLFLSANHFAGAQPADETLSAKSEPREETPEELRERQIQERFFELLKRTPRFGTALDRVYGFHVERGSLDSFVDGLREQATTGEDPGLSWMILGLFEFQRGNDGAAVEAFTQAEELREEDPLASYYLGRSLVLIGDTDKAADAFERALVRKPSRIDLMEIFQVLGRTYQRSQQKGEAAKIWDRLEGLFPDDLQVREEISHIIAEEGDHEAALLRFRKLAEEAKEPYQQVRYRMQVGQLLIRLRKTDEAVELFEQTLMKLKPESWLHRDVRTQIEHVFLAADDYNGLTEYYEKWLADHPDDIEAMGRVAHILAVQGRLPEARVWYARAIKLAPNNTGLRESLISRLIDAGKHEPAIEQYRELDKIDPGNADYIEKWGQLVFENPANDEKQRTADAAKIWNKMREGHENDPVIVIRVADLLRYAKLTDEAIALYKQAIDLAPGNPQYREYLGEYYHLLKQPAQAKEVWQQIASGPRRNRENLVRLAEVYAGFGLTEEALQMMGEACQLDPEFPDRMQYAVMLREAEQYEASHAQLDQALKLADNEEQKQGVLLERIDTFRAANQLQAEIDKLQKQLDGPDANSADGWRRLAVYLQAISRADRAVVAIEKSLELDDKSIPTLSLAATLYETVGRIEDAVELQRTLSVLDRQFRSQYLQKIALLEMRLGRTDAALKAADELIASASGNPEHYGFYADLCFRMGDSDKGLDALRRAVRVNPSDPSALLTLARSLGEQFRTAEAIELYWRAFDKSDQLEDKLSLIGAVTELYLRTSHFDKLIEKLERMARQGGQQRDITLCKATAYKTLGDFGKAREILEQLLNEENRDIVLLQELVRLANSENEYSEAARYQRRVLELSPTRENEVQLAQILLQSGELDEAEALWTKLVAAEQEQHRVFSSLDQMIGLEKHETVLALVEKLLRENPGDWEALYRKGVVLWKLDRKEESVALFEKLGAMDLPDDEMSSDEKHKEAQRKQRGSSATTASMTRNYPPTILRGQAFHQMQQILANNTNQRSSRWAPTDFGQVRIACLAVRYQFATEQGKGPEFAAELKAKTEAAAKENPKKLWDLMYLQSYLEPNENRYREQYEFALRISKELNDDAAKFVFLSSLRMRNYQQGMQNLQQAQETAEPLSDEDIEHMLACFEQVHSAHPEWIGYAGGFQVIHTELRLAKKEDLAEQMYQDLLAESNDAGSLSTAMMMAATAGKIDDVIELAQKSQDLRSGSSTAAAQQQAQQQQAFAMLLQKLGDEKKLDEMLRLLFEQLEFQKRQYLAMPIHRRSRVTATNSPIRVRMVKEGAAIQVNLNYPRINPFYDSADISFAYQVFHYWKEQDKADEFLEQLRARANSAEDIDQIFSRLALAYALWWSEDQRGSQNQIESLAREYPNESFLQIELVDSYYRAKRYSEALEVIDRVQPPDRKLLEQCEIIALQLAVQVGDLERARTAARRLFGMQLDTNLQMQLASQMNQLGMRELGDAVLARTRRKAGNRTSTLVQLMQQYTSQGDDDIAQQIALQILRKTSGSNSSNQNNSAEKSIRDQALKLLAHSGALEKQIERLEAQLAESPDSKRLNETILDFYQAAGRTDDANKIMEKIAESQPDDATFQLAQAKKMYAARNYTAASDHYRNAILAKPELVGNEIYNVRRAFQQAKRESELIDLYLQLDLTKMQQHYYRVDDIVNQISQFENGKRRDDAVIFFTRAWDAFPQNQQYLLSNLRDEKMWETDTIYNYALETLIPGEKSTVSDPWQGINGGSNSLSQDGSLSGVLSRVVAGIGENEKRRTEFTNATEASLKAHKNWKSGEMYLALFEAQKGDRDAANKRVATLLEDPLMKGNQQIGWTFASELSQIQNMEQAAIDVLEVTTADSLVSSQYSGNSMNYTPGRLLVAMYQKKGRREDARELLYKLMKSQDYSQQNQYNPGYGEYQELQDSQTAASILLEMNYVIDSIRVYEGALADESRFTAASRYGGSNFKKRMEDGLEKARKKLTPEILRESLADLIPTPKEETKFAGIEFAISVQPKTIEKAALKSFFEDSLESVEVTDDSQKTFAQLNEKVVALRKHAPDDLSLDVVEALVAFKAKASPETMTPILDQISKKLARVVDAKEDQQPADDQLVAVWLVARKALRSEAHREAGETLTSRLIAAAPQISDPLSLLAILRERGEIALEHNDRETAQKYWAKMLDEILNSRAVSAVDSQNTRPSTTSFRTIRYAPATVVP